MTENRGLPSGRGLRDSPDLIDQGESFSQRQSQLPLQDGGIVSVLPPYSFNSVQTFTANRLLFHAIPVVSRDTSVEEVRIRITTPAASQTAKVALFVFDRSSRVFSQVPSSKATFRTDSAGVPALGLLNPVRVLANVSYFLAFLPSSATPAFATMGSGAGVVAQLYRDGPTEMPTSIPLSSLSRTSLALYVPGVVYLSRLWKDVL